MREPVEGTTGATAHWSKWTKCFPTHSASTDLILIALSLPWVTAAVSVMTRVVALAMGVTVVLAGGAEEGFNNSRICSSELQTPDDF